jgi:hypothetical protein
MKRLMLMTAAMLGAMVLVGCKDETTAPPTPTASAATSTDALPAGLFATSAPAGAVDVVAARTSAKDGDAVVVKGVIAGAMEPIAANRAIMTVADTTLATCDKTPGDSCKTPWDACCEPSDQIAAKSVSVQVVGADGRPMKATLGGATGLAPLKHVIIAGTMRVPQGNGTPVIEAKQIYMQK